tara:strand:+ start:130 stop:912 length:783 start_codon:yes stop_codon:yes gene_type:complete
MRFAKKSLGQNFLIDKNIIKKIINLTEVKKKNVLEIGPGTGSLTDEILKKNPKSLSIIEKDNILTEKLKIKYLGNKKIKIINADILEYDFEKILHKDSVIFGNLPYNISSQILVKILKLKKWPPNFKDLILMFQKELGEKILGKYETSKYGRLSILVNYRLSTKKKFFVSPNCFFPKPKVISQVIHFCPKTESKIIKNLDNLEKITSLLFSNKRKMINKRIKKILNKDQLNKIDGLKLNLRPAQLSPETYYKITQLFEEK